ncbi:hypothetical protein [Clostridium sp. KNHs214]|uniref:hypothetical protein n=1 Tax=Clostridium sp. KNHs214 TaxID=1540257 RepID=UPI0005595611|nr:hypothetical protein [Clostridium sp. KNHs214]
MVNFLMALNLILILAAIVLFVRSFIIKYIASYNESKNILFVGLIVACLLLSINGVVKCAQVNEFKEVLKLEGSFFGDGTIKMIEDGIAMLTKSMIKTISIGYGCLLAAILLTFSFKREFKRELAKPKYRWDWSRIILK